MLIYRYATYSHQYHSKATKNSDKISMISAENLALEVAARQSIIPRKMPAENQALEFSAFTANPFPVMTTGISLCSNSTL